MSVWVTLYAAVLFFVLSPNVLLRLPPKGGKFLVAGVHAIIFALIFYLTHNLVWQMTSNLEGVMNPPPPPREQMRDQQMRDQQMRDQQMRDQQMRDQQMRDQQMQQRMRDQQMRDQQMRDQMRGV
jgi:hypothetical protein